MNNYYPMGDTVIAFPLNNDAFIVQSGEKLNSYARTTDTTVIIMETQMRVQYQSLICLNDQPVSREL